MSDSGGGDEVGDSDARARRAQVWPKTVATAADSTPTNRSTIVRLVCGSKKRQNIQISGRFARTCRGWRAKLIAAAAVVVVEALETGRHTNERRADICLSIKRCAPRDNNGAANIVVVIIIGRTYAAC